MKPLMSFVFWSEGNAQTVPLVFLGLLALSLILRRLLLRKDEKIRNLPFLLITVALVSLEIVKQIREHSFGSVSLRAIPLYYSSIFLYIFPVANFSWGRFSRFMKGIAGTTSTIAGYFLLLNPHDVIGEHSAAFFTSFPDFHTVFYHYALLFYALLFLLLEVHVPEPKKDLKRLYVTLAVYSVIGGIAANVLQTNYNSFYTSGFPPIEALRQECVAAWGFVPTQIVYVFLVFMSMIAFGTVSYFIYVLVTKLLVFSHRRSDERKALRTVRTN